MRKRRSRRKDFRGIIKSAGNFLLEFFRKAAAFIRSVPGFFRRIWARIGEYRSKRHSPDAVHRSFWRQISPIAPRIYFPSDAALFRRRLTTAVTVVCAFIMAVSLWKIGAYMLAGRSSRNVSEEMRQAYREETVPDEVTPEPVLTEEPQTASPQEAPVSAPPVSAAVTVSPYLPPVSYPDNPYNVIQSRFKKLRGINSDIVGWVTIDGMLDEAVVQRDNDYYLRRDYKGYHNENGAIFMEQTIKMKTRPATIVLYGHNMKSGTMFGCLHEYDHLAQFKAHPFVTFDSIYEDGTYVIFSAATLSLDTSRYASVNFGALLSSSRDLREKEIRKLQYNSLYSVPVNVASDDQLLLLVTCAKDDDTRRVVAARRLRDGETVESLQKIVSHAQNR